jgi:protein TonB
MSAQMERIRAALARPEATRQTGDPLLPDSEAQNGRPAIAISEENLAVLLGTKAPANSSEGDTRPGVPAASERKEIHAAVLEPEPVPDELPQVAPTVDEPTSGAAAQSEQVSGETALAEAGLEQDSQPPAILSESAILPEPISTSDALAESRAFETTLSLLAARQGAATDTNALELSGRPPSWVNAPPLERPEKATPELPFEFSASEEPRVQLRWMIAAMGALILVGGVSTYLLRHRSAPPKSEGTSASDFPLQMQVQPQGNGLLSVRWHPQSTAVTSARQGRLVITESGQEPRTVTLEPEQLKMGHLDYQAASERTGLRLEVTNHSGAVAGESVLALSPTIIPAPAAAASAQVSPTAPPRDLASKDEAPIEAREVGTSDAPPPAKAAVRTFTPPPGRRADPEVRTALIEAPAALPPGTVSLPGTAAISVTANIPAIPPPPGKETLAPQRISVGGNLEAANLIRKVTPVYPPLAQKARVQGMVRFTAIISKDGTVQNLQLVSGHPLLVQAANDAVKRWLYRPTLLNGEAVEVVTQIDVNFSINP